MEVRRVVEVKSVGTKEGRKPFVFFTQPGKELENKNKKLQYKKGDIVFVEKDNEGRFMIKEHHSYYGLMKYLDKFDKRNEVNKALLLNKFTNIFNLSSYYFMDNSKEKDILKKIQKNNKFVRDNFGKNYKWRMYSARISDKLIVGLGNQSVFENDITLHHTYGIPYIPGQAIKGMFRNYIIQEYFKKCSGGCNTKCEKDCEKNAINHKGFSLIFGGKNHFGEDIQGKVIFMDSFPCENFMIKRDIITTHHKNYYCKDKSEFPLDTDDTTPIPFLVLEKSQFQINIAIDKKVCNKEWCEGSKINIEDFVSENLRDALIFHGIGAKTSIGYGYFEEVNDEK